MEKATNKAQAKAAAAAEKKAADDKVHRDMMLSMTTRKGQPADVKKFLSEGADVETLNAYNVGRLQNCACVSLFCGPSGGTHKNNPCGVVSAFQPRGHPAYPRFESNDDGTGCGCFWFVDKNPIRLQMTPLHRAAMHGGTGSTAEQQHESADVMTML